MPELRAFVERMAAADAFSGSVLLAQDGQVLFETAVGLAHKSYDVPNRVDTKFNLGSMNKMFTAVAIGQLVEAGRLAYEDPLSKHLDSSWLAPELLEKIQIRHLLCHTSGLGSYFNDEFMNSSRERFRIIDDYKPLVVNETLAFTPGTSERYSNTGYLLLGAVIEKVTGGSYFDYVRAHIYAPAGMIDSDSYEMDKVVPNLALGYTPEPDGSYTNNLYQHVIKGGPAGGGFSTVHDLLRFDQALRAGRLVSMQTAGLHWSPKPELGAPKYGYGFAIEGRPGDTIVGHDGGFPGISAHLGMHLDTGWTVVVLSNYGQAAMVIVDKIEELLGRLRTGEPVAARRGADPTTDTPETSDVPAAGVEVPMELPGGPPVVEVFVNEQGPYRLALDTGAAGCGVISARLAQQLALEVVGQVIAGDPSGQNQRTMERVGVDSIRIGHAVFRGLEMLKRDAAFEAHAQQMIAQTDGVLGFQLFSECLLTLDYPNRRLRIERGALPSPDGSEILPFGQADGVPSIDITVGDVKLLAHIDSGSMGRLSVPERFVPQLALREAPQVVGKARTLFNEFEIKEARADGNVRIGGHVLASPRLTFEGLLPYANIGEQVLRHFVLTFDQVHDRVRLTRSGSGPLELEPRYRVGLLTRRQGDAVIVEDVVPEGPADRAGLRPGDRILRANGQPVSELDHAGMMRLFGRPQPVQLTVQRDQQELAIEVTPAPES